MQRDHHSYTKKAVPTFLNQVANDYTNHIPVPPAFGAALPPVAKPSMPFHGIEFQPSQVCPKNFIVFDQTDYRSQILYHPTMAQKFNSQNLNMFATYIQDNIERKDDAMNVEKDMSTSLKEDSDDIDALLSLEEEDELGEEYDDEEVSTARTNGNYGSCSDSGSGYCSEPQRNNMSSSMLNTGHCNSERKRKRVKEMVKMLRGIVPGGDQMNTAAVLDEAVKYLKSLKVEVQKLGVGNSKT